MENRVAKTLENEMDRDYVVDGRAYGFQELGLPFEGSP